MRRRKPSGESAQDRRRARGGRRAALPVAAHRRELVHVRAVHAPGSAPGAAGGLDFCRRGGGRGPIQGGGGVAGTNHTRRGGRMNRNAWSVPAAGAVTTLALAFALISMPASAPAQKASETPAAPLPPGYAGAETCKGCHAEQYEKFSHTKMGRLFLHQPRNTSESLGCENCHGPGKEHADAGGGRGVGGMITFAKNDKTPVEKRNAMCLTCHTKGERVFWKGSPHEMRDLACTSCHTVMENVSVKSQLKKETEL